MNRLLFTAGGSPGQEGIYRLLKDRYDLYFADLQIRKMSDVIPEKKKLVVPAVAAENYLDKIIFNVWLSAPQLLPTPPQFLLPINGLIVYPMSVDFRQAQSLLCLSNALNSSPHPHLPIVQYIPSQYKP